MACALAHRGSTALRRIALLTVVAFGCATTRPPGGGPLQLGVAPRVALAEPAVDLWMEGTEPVNPNESGAAFSQAHEAMLAAVAGRAGLDSPDPEQVLVVRARGIARTEERKSAQVWSIVFVIFVVVAIIVTTVLLSHTKSGPRSAPATGYGPPGGHAVAPAPAPGFRPGPAFVPRPYPPPIGVYVGFSLWIPAEPLPPVPWMEPTEAWLSRRSWYDGDALELTVELADPETGAVSWQQTVRESADPRDPVAVSALLDRALAGMPFGQRLAPVAPLDPLLPPAPATPPAPGDHPPPGMPPAPPEELPPPPPAVPGGVAPPPPGR